jgi:phage/plasmid-associated DNA primase
MFKMNIMEFANLNNEGNYQPIHLKITDGNKDLQYNERHSYKPKPNDRIATIKKRQKLPNEDCNYVTLKTGIHCMVIDVDFKEDVEYHPEAVDFVKKMKKNHPYTKSTTKKLGCHIFFKPNNTFINATKNYDRYTYPSTHNLYGIEILTKCWCFQDLNVLVEQANMFKEVIDMPVFKKIRTVTTKLTKCTSRVDDIIDNVPNFLNIHPSYISHYKDWSTIIGSIALYGEQYKETARELSKTTTRDNFSNEAFNLEWSKVFKTTKKAVLWYIDRNPEGEEDIDIFKFNVADNYYTLRQDDYIINLTNGTQVYKFHNGFWMELSKPYLLLRAEIVKIMKPVLLDLINNSTCKDKTKEYKKCFADLSSNSVSRQQYVQLFIDCMVDNWKEDIEFDTIQHLYHFKNKCFDLKTLEFTDNLKEHYATIHASTLQEDDELKTLELTKIIESIFPIKDIRDNFLTVLCNTLSGTPLEKIIFLNGSGSNGKSLLNKYMSDLHGNYYYPATPSIITQPMKLGGCPEISNMSNKRMVCFEEPNENETIKFSTVKELTGCDSICSRTLYSTNTNCTMSGAKFIICNKRLKLEGDTGVSMSRRVVDILYTECFKGVDDVSRHEGDTFRDIDLRLPTKDYRDYLGSSMFYVLLNHMKTNNLNYHNLSDLKLCDSIKQRSKAYIEGNNKVLQTINDICLLNVGQYVQITDISKRIINTDEYKNVFTKKEKALYGKGTLVRTISEDPQLSRYFCKRKMIEGRNLHNILMDHSLIEIELGKDEMIDID